MRPKDWKNECGKRRLKPNPWGLQYWKALEEWGARKGDREVELREQEWVVSESHMCKKGGSEWFCHLVLINQVRWGLKIAVLDLVIMEVTGEHDKSDTSTAGGIRACMKPIKKDGRKEEEETATINNTKGILIHNHFSNRSKIQLVYFERLKRR